MMRLGGGHAIERLTHVINHAWVTERPPEDKTCRETSRDHTPPSEDLPPMSLLSWAHGADRQRSMPNLSPHSVFATCLIIKRAHEFCWDRHLDVISRCQNFFCCCRPRVRLGDPYRRWSPCKDVSVSVSSKGLVCASIMRDSACVSVDSGVRRGCDRPVQLHHSPSGGPRSLPRL